MEHLLLWYNLIFILPFGLAVLYLLIMSVGLLPIDFGLGVDHDFDVDIDHDVDLDHDVDSDVGAGDAFKALSILGVGKVPLSIILIAMLLLWGALGWLTNNVLEDLLQTSSAYAAISMAVAFIGSLLLTSLLSKALVRLVPTSETYASSFYDLIGHVGTALHDVDANFGRVRVLNAHNTLIDVTCVVDTEESSIPEGSKVLLYDYDPKERRFLGQIYTDD